MADYEKLSPGEKTLHTKLIKLLLPELSDPVQARVGYDTGILAYSTHKYTYTDKDENGNELEKESTMVDISSDTSIIVRFDQTECVITVCSPKPLTPSSEYFKFTTKDMCEGRKQYILKYGENWRLSTVAYAIRNKEGNSQWFPH